MEVMYSRTQFKANPKDSGYDFLVFVYAPSDLIDRENDPKRKFSVLD